MDMAGPENRVPDWNPAERASLDERMRRQSEVSQRCPVAWASYQGGTWSVLRYADVVRATMDTETFSNAAQPRYGKPLPPLEVDPPHHRVYRRALQPFFTPERVKQIEEKIRPLTAALVDRLVAEREVDLARELAYPVPVFGLCALVGAPSGNWSAIKTMSENSLMLDSDKAAERALAREAHEGLMAMSRGMVADRRQHPRDPSTDITSALLAARIDDETMDDETAAGSLRLLFSAGHNSTTSAIGNALVHLAEHRDHQDTLRSNPDAIPAAVEELLRLYTPVQQMLRVATRDTELHGCPIKKGERLGMFWSAANRDPEVFADPDSYRPDRSPNRHIAFGHGIHTCIGSPMARMEIRLTLEELLARTSGFEATGPIERPPFHRIGVTRLPARLYAQA
jgi:cytochrome P450